MYTVFIFIQILFRKVAFMEKNDHLCNHYLSSLTCLYVHDTKEGGRRGRDRTVVGVILPLQSMHFTTRVATSNIM